LTESNGGSSILGVADSVGAVTDTVSKVLVVAKTGNVGRLAAQAGSKTEHVVDAELLKEER
jgi:hypothetical protein